MSTRQRLEEFKRKLAESQLGKVTTSSKQSDGDGNSTEAVRAPTPKQKVIESTTPSTKTNTRPTSRSEKVEVPKSDSKVVKEVPKSSIFQHRIEHEKPKRERSIDRILSKYRTSATETQADNADSRERSAQVDKILAKYRSTDKKVDTRNDSKVFQVAPSGSQKTVKKRATNNRTDSNKQAVAEKSPSPQSERDSGYGSSVASESKYRERWTPNEVSRVQVPNSAMEYDAARLHSGDQRHQKRDTVKQDERHYQSIKSSKLLEHTSQRDFDATLKSMLEMRQGHHSRRTEAWANNMQAAKNVTNSNQVFVLF